MMTAWHDVRYAFRQLCKSPGFAVVTILTLALGIGSIVAIFSMINAVLLRALPYRDPGRLVKIHSQFLNTSQGGPSVGLEEYLELRHQGQSFEQVAAVNDFKVKIQSPDETWHVPAGEVSGDFFNLMGISAEQGRSLQPGDAVAGAPPVVVISRGLLLRAFGSNKNVIGLALEVDSVLHTIVGVMPMSFTYPSQGANHACDIWIPTILDSGLAPGSNRRGFHVLGRLKNGVSLARANMELKVISDRRNLNLDDAFKSVLLTQPLQGSDVAGGQRHALWLLLGAVGLILLIAGANVANLLLVRAATRTREMAIRQGLGAHWGDLARPFLIESLLISLGGGILGTWWAWMALKALVQTASKMLPRAGTAGLDWVVLGFSLSVSILVGLAIGLTAAWHSARINLVDHLKHSTTGGMGTSYSRRCLRHSLAGLQVALSLTLVLTAGLLMRSFFRLSQVDVGLNPRNALLISLGKESLNRQAELLERLQAIPDVQALGASTTRPFNWGAHVATVLVESNPGLGVGKDPFEMTCLIPTVTQQWFQAAGIPVLRGRGFLPTDSKINSAVVVNESFVKRFLGSGDPLGQKVKAGTGDFAPIVGVVKDVRNRPQYPAMPAMYHLVGCAGWGDVTHWVLRSRSGDLATLAGQARPLIRETDKIIPIFDIQPLTDILENSIAAERFQTLLLGVFSALALTLCLVGIDGVVSYDVTQRTREFGLRMALGALRHQIVLLPLRQAAPFLLVGIVIGLSVAAAIGKIMASLLFQVNPLDSLTFVAATAFFTLAVLAACAVPAYRAAKIDPMEALRYE
jgi:putative ABC transport system permease protein